MRSRKIIEYDFQEGRQFEEHRDTHILEVLLDIRELLKKKQNK